MPVTINRKKFLYVSEWADAFGIVLNTAMNWIRDGLPHITIGQGQKRKVHLIPKVEGLAYAKKEWGVIPIRKLP
jgi:predicted site-specific integrase-resolvase